MNFYSLEDFTSMEKSFSARIDLQYYANRPVDKKIIGESKRGCKDFFIKTKEILLRINESQIKEIRNNLKN